MTATSSPQGGPADAIIKAPAEQADWEASYLAGRTLREVAAEAGVSPRTVARALQARDVPRRVAGRRGPTAERLAALAAAYQAGMSLDRLVDEAGVHRGTLHRWLRTAGVAPRRRGAQGSARKRVYPVAEWAAAHAAGESISRIAKTAGVHRATVADRLSPVGQEDH